MPSRQAPKKQRHTAQRIFDWHKVERGYTGGVTMVKEAVREWKDTERGVSCRCHVRRATRKSTSTHLAPKQIH